ncbi:MAG: AMP-dependent synthetase [Chitinophagaceae bacterium]|nr:AMP-dependent synthetase [Chitinophagaceae bacterium]
MLDIQFTSSPPDLSELLEDENLRPAIDLINKWYEGSESFTFLSSGSTGTPKEITLSKKFLIASANRTIEFFNIQSSDTLLLALNTSFMGGMMMIVRAIVAKTHLIYIAPKNLTSSILCDLPPIKLASLVPYQATVLLRENKLDPFVSIQNLLLGGAPIDGTLQQKLFALESPCHFYHTYGMTETASHVAIKEITHNPSCYNALKGFSFSTDDRDCLVIHYLNVPLMNWKTNDVIALHSSTSFEWIGRIDWVVNSGGVKFNLERAEECVAIFFHDQQIHTMYTSYKIPDQTWGEKWILITEEPLSALEIDALKNYCKKTLGKYIYPQDIYTIKKIVYLPSGKVDRISSFKEATRLSI